VLFNNSSIFNFKQLSAYGQALKTTSTDVGELSKLTSLLTTEQTINALSSKGLTDQQVVQILMNKGIVQSEAEAIASKMASSSANGVATFSLKAYTVALWENIKAIGAWLLTNPVGWIIGIGVAIGGTVAAYNFFTETIEEQKEKISELKTEYEGIIQELDTLGDEIKKNTIRIYELKGLQSQGEITLVEQDELNKLVLANELLKEQKTLIEDEKEEKGRELAQANKDTFTEEYGSNADLEAQYNSFGYSMYGANIMSGEDLSDKDLILSIDALYTGISDAVENGDDLTVQSLTEGQDYLIDLLQGRSNAILTELLKYQDTLSAYMNPDGSFDDPEYQQLWDDIESWKEKVYKQTGRSGEWNTIQLNLALNDSSLANTQKEIQQKFSEGTLTESDILQYDNLIASLKNANLILGEGETVASVYLSYLNGIATSQDQVNSSTPDFSFGASNQAPIDNYQSSLSTLSDALNKIRDNSLTDSDMVDLLQAFPSLTNKTDTLSESIQILIDDKLEALKNSLKATGASDEILTLFDDITEKSSGINLNNVLSTLKNTDSMIKTVNAEIEESGKISTDTIQTILSGYPDLEDAVYRYLQGKLSEEDMLKLLRGQYETDLENYKLYILQKKGEDGNFYKTLVSLMSDDLINKAKAYGIDFNNYKNLCEAKLALDKRYAQKKLILDRANAELNAGYDKVENTTGDTRVNAEYDTKELKRTQILAQQDLDEFQSIIDGVDTTIEETVEFDTSLNFKDTTTGTGKDKTKKEKEEKQGIDWLEQSLKVLQNEVDKFQTTLDNTHGIDNQLKAIDNLNAALKNLKGGYEEAYDNYEDRYNSALNSLGSKAGKSIKKKIESGEEFDLKEYSPETAKKIQAAIDAYNQMVETDEKIKSLDKEMADNENLEKSKLSQADYESQLATVNTLLDDQTLTTKEKNALLDRQLELEKSINAELRKQAIYNGDTETVNKLDAEDKNNSVQKKLNKIQNNKDENQKLIDKYNSQLEDTTLTVDEIEDINDKLQDAINNDFDYQMEAEIAGIDSAVWKKYITSLKKKYKETKLSDEKFIKKHIEEIANNFDDTDMSKIYQEQIQSQAEHENTQYEIHKTDRNNRIQMNENDIQDINNDIEAQGGQGTKSQYEEMQKIYQGNLIYLEEQKRDAEAMLATTDEGTEAWYKWNNELQEAEDNIANCNQQIKDCHISILKLPLNEVEDSLDEIGKRIEDVDERISEKDTLISAATAILDDEIENNEILKQVIQDQISALQEENDLRQSNLELQKAEYALEKAKNQKTSKVYREGQGFVYEANSDDIQSAQENYDTLMFERKISLLGKQSSSYDDEIYRLNEIKNNWSNISGDTQDSMNIDKAVAYDPDFKNNVLTSDAPLLTSISSDYQSLMQQRSIYEEQQADYQKLQEEINEIIRKYEEEGISYEESRKRISLALQTYYPELLTNFESESGTLDKIIENKITDATVSEETSALMLENYKKFFGEMTVIFDDLNDLLDKFAHNTQDMVNATSHAISTLRDALQGTFTEANSVASAKNALLGFSVGSAVLRGMQGVGKSHSGMELGYPGESSTSKNKENFKVLALDKLEPNELIRIIKKGEGIVTDGQINTVMSNFKNLAEVKIPTVTPLQKQTTNQSLNFNGDIIVQSNGENVNTLAHKIKTQLPNSFLQELSK